MKYAVNNESGKQFYPLKHHGKLYVLCDEMVYWVPIDKEGFEKFRSVYKLRFLSDYMNLYTEEVNYESGNDFSCVTYEFEELLYDVADENEKLSENDDLVKEQLEVLKRFIDDGRIFLGNNPLWIKEAWKSEEELKERGEKDKIFDAWMKEKIQKLSGGKYQFVNSSYDMQGEDRILFNQEHFYTVAGGVAIDVYGENTCRGIASAGTNGSYDFVNFARVFEMSSQETTLRENPDNHYPMEYFDFQLLCMEEGKGQLALSASALKEGDKEITLPYRFCGMEVTDVGHITAPELETVTIPNSYTSIYGGFHNAKALKTVILSEKISVIPEECFYGCESLTETPKNSQIKEFGKNAFRGCTSLKKIYFGKKLSKIGEAAFAECTSLKKVSIPKSIDTIPVSAFENCTSLSDVQLPETIKRIERLAFSGCTSLKKLRLPMSLETIEANALPAGVTLISASYIEMVGNIVENDRYADLQLTYEVEDGSKPKSKKELEQETLALEKEAKEAAEKEAEERKKQQEEANLQYFQNLCMKLIDKERKKLLVSPEAEAEDIFKALTDCYSGTDKILLNTNGEAFFKLYNEKEEKLKLLRKIADIEVVEDGSVTGIEVLGKEDADVSELLLSPEEEENYVNPLKNFLKTMPLLGDKPFFTVVKGENLEPIKEAIVQKLMAAGNVMHVMQLNSQFMFPAVREKYILQLEILRVFADIKVDEPVAEEEPVPEEVEEAPVPEEEPVVEEEFISEEEEPVVEEEFIAVEEEPVPEEVEETLVPEEEPVPEEVEDVLVEEEDSVQEDEIIHIIEQDSKQNFEELFKLESSGGNSFLFAVVSRDCFSKMIPEVEQEESSFKQIIIADNAVYFVEKEELVKVDLLSRREKRMQIEQDTAMRLKNTIEESGGCNQRFLEDSCCINYLWEQLAALNSGEQKAAANLEKLLTAFNEQITCLNSEEGFSIWLGENALSVSRVIEYICEKVKSPIYEMIE